MDVVRRVPGYKSAVCRGVGQSIMGLAVQAGHLSPLRALSPGMFWARSRWSRMYSISPPKFKKSSGSVRTDMMPKARRAAEETQSWVARDLEARPPRLRNLVVRATQRTAKLANQQALCWEAPGGGRLLGWVPETYEVDWSEPEAGPGRERWF